MAKKFYVEGMTVDQILNASWNDLNRLNKREMSRALRTVSLAVNKRIGKLKQYAKKTKDGYVAKGSSRQVALDALNWVTNDGHTRKKFGTGNLTRNEMFEQLRIARQFWNMKSSTIKGASELRRDREKAIFGKTREQAVRGIRTKKGKDAIYREYDQKMKDMWEAYHKFMELNGGRDAHALIDNSDSIQSYIGEIVVDEEFEEGETGLTERRIDELAKLGKKEWTRLQDEKKDAAAAALKNMPGQFPRG